MTYECRESAGPDLGAIQALIDEHFPFDCNLIEVETDRWVIHGSIPVGGEVILAEFDNLDVAVAALELLAAAEKQTDTPSARQGATP